MLRLENKDGIGPFRSRRDYELLDGYERNEISQYLSQHNDFPTPSQECLPTDIPGLTEPIELYCAYACEDMFKRFCTLNQFMALIKLGYRLYKIEAEQVYYGNYQNTFIKESIKNKVDVTDEFLLNY